MDLIPCIKYDPNTWGEIRRNLKEYGYRVKIDCINPDVIVINYCGNLGDVTDVGMNDIKNYNRELVSDMYEFLDRAKKLIGYMKEEFTKEDLKPGMLVLWMDSLCLVTGSTNGLCLSGENCWVTIESLKWDDVTEVWDVTNPWNAYFLNPEGRKLLYEKKVEKVLTMQEIANKFGISVEQLRIKK